ncbi:helix-turn-helix domain-containing protein [Ferroglobus sp.]|uniref:helix-turn-helix domain-containing protein n=1 Tax=Ferroglobus sp. TaxID=2614230 RepID=UPI0025BA614A|nr:helix-turn-helix domain-containing protein [Ferroglobus sp.]
MEFTEKDERLVELLTEAGLNKNIAKVLVYLSKVGETVSRDIERAANLRQPEVSIAMKELKEMGWVKDREIKKKGKGRPLKSYKLTLDLKDIVSELVRKKREEIQKLEKDLEELEKLVGLK